VYTAGVPEASHRVGPYEIIREIGRGGMGVVYLARDERLARDVAIKALPEDLSADPGRLDRFEREAKALAQLSHPNIAGIYGVEEQDGQRYLILEYVEGETLGERLDRGPLPVDEAIEFAVDVAQGLEAAHDAGLVHRDLKPDNIKITPEGKVKVLDFGLAKASEGSTSGTDLSQSPTLTSPQPRHSPTIPGAILGTAAYMSPEQARGRRVDKRTDIWSFGVILYEMLTGSGPFVGETATDSIGAVLHKEVDLGRLPDATPLDVRRAIWRCLERNRDLRYRDIGDVRLELLGGLSQPPGVSEGSRRPRRFWAPVAVIGWVSAAIALLSVATGVWPGNAQRAADGRVRSAVMAPDGYVIDDFDIAPDGNQIAMLVQAADVGSLPGPRRSSLYVRDLGAEVPVLVEGSDGAFALSYAPDGRTIVFITRGADSSGAERLMRFPRDLSATPVEVMRVPTGVTGGWRSRRFCWTPSGEIAFLHRKDRALLLFDPGTGREIRRIAVKSEDPDLDLDGLEGPFGNQAIALQVNRFTEDRFVVDAGVIDLASGELSIVVDNAVSLQAIPRDRVLFARSDSVFVSPFDPKSRSLTGSFRSVQRGLGTGLHWAHGWFDVANNGTLVYAGGGVQGQSRELVFIDRDGTARVWFDEKRSFEERAAISLDGLRLATIISGPGGLFELWVSETDRPRLRRLHREPGGDANEPVLSPDGEWVVSACWSNRGENQRRLMAFRFDGSEPPRQLWGGWGETEWVIPESVSYDGERVLIVHYASGKAYLREVPMDGSSEPRLLLELDGIFSPRYAPSEDPLLCYVSTETGRAEVFLRTISESGVGPAMPVTTRGAWTSNWRYDEEEGLAILHFDLAWREHVTPISFENGRIEIGQSEPTGSVGNTRYLDRSITRDGRYLTIRQGEDESPVTHLEMVQGWLDSIVGR